MPRDDWRPLGVDDLEPAAWKALKATSNTVVVAGPGAGKTEFLAQRAAYLLQTGLCAPPFQILAISFKKDAATNLEARVASRCAQEQASRFRSLTFDAFTKSIVDRFITTIPATWRPTKPYEITFHSARYHIDILELARATAPSEWKREIVEIQAGDFEPKNVGTWRLPNPNRPAENAIEFAIATWWSEHLPKNNTSTLTFTLLNRLAELIVRANPHILHALRATYPFVFLDEFQDTTYAQYDFLLTAFQRSNCVLTAVGDEKQRIMAWAGARTDAFDRLADDFKTDRVELEMNFRSSSDLVKIQQVVARAIDPRAPAVSSMKTSSISDEVAQIWRFRSSEQQASHIARWLRQDLDLRKLTPRDYALIVRQKPEVYESQLADKLREVEIALRNEAKKVGKTTLQDLLAEELVIVAVAVMRVVIQGQAPNAWRIATDALYRLRGIPLLDEREAKRISEELSNFITAQKRKLRRSAPNDAGAAAFGNDVLAFLNVAGFRRAYRQYATGDALDIAREAFYAHLTDSATTQESWTAAIDVFEGVDHVPLMTVHKSKGLEYDTTLFLGLDDDAWWSYKPGDREGLATFFVALSRAKQRAVFCYCADRRTLRVRELHQLLLNAGVREHDLTTE
jgi:superfamily I DNA/RNA helicase